MNLPHDFIERTRPLLGKEWDTFTASLEQYAPISIRLNKKKLTKNRDISQYIPVPWCEKAYYLNNRPQFTFDPLFHAGCYYVQEASSMFIGQAFKQYVEDDVKVLDLCAAPGGKSTLIANQISDNSLLVSNEVIRARSNILSENLTKWGQPNVLVTNNDPAQIGSKLKNYFDVILVDAPCSGEGMFRKDEGAVAEWSVDNVKLCQQRQRRILADVWDALMPGGLLMYSTCTYNLEENEHNVQWLCDELGADNLPVNIEGEWNISPSFIDGIFAYRFFPHKTKGEGFFFSIVRKHGEDTHSKYRLPKNKQQEKKNSPAIVDICKNWLINKEQFSFIDRNNILYAFPQLLKPDFVYLLLQTNMVSAGIRLGELKGKDLIPHQSLAMSNNLSEKAFTNYEIDWHTAIAYLKKEPLTMTDIPKGYILLKYKDTPLGFVKNIGNRANNLYPQEWRIRSGNIPENEISAL